MTSKSPTSNSPASKAATAAAAPFAIGTEVFLLNSATDRNASAGIPTFTIVTATDTAPPPPPPSSTPVPPDVPADPCGPKPTTTTIQQTYRLTPTSNTFEVPGARLRSAVGTFPRGAIVRQKSAMLSARVEARYVVDERVRYDVRDELATVMRGVGRDGEAGVVDGDGLVRFEGGGQGQGRYWPVEMGDGVGRR